MSARPTTSSLHGDVYRHTVYLHRDAAGDVLYVGCTIDLTTRTRRHRRGSPWRDEIASVEIVAEDMDRYPALDLERALIERYRPPHNYVGSPEWLADMGRRAAHRLAFGGDVE